MGSFCKFDEGLKISKKISIIIVTANREKLFAKCLASLVAAVDQTDSAAAGFEFLIVINGPGNASREIAAALLAERNYSIIELPHSLHPGAARNRAIDIVSGDWIFFADDDIFIDKYFFQHFSDLCSRRDGFSVMGGPNLTPPTSNSFQELSGHVLTSYFTSFHCAQRYHLAEEKTDTDDSALTLCNLFVKKSALSTSRFSNSLVCAEENLLLTELAGKGHRFLTHPDLKAFHERRNTLKTFVSQISKYGRGRGQLVFRRQARWFHFVPFVCGVALLGAVLIPSMRAAVIALSLLYVILLFFSAHRIITIHRRTQWDLAKIAFLIIAVHLNDGVGFCLGMLSGLRRRRHGIL